MEPLLPAPHKVTGEFGLYIHIPFCEHRCHYCDFNAYSGLDHLASEYMAALVTDVGHASAAPPGTLGIRPTVTSVFLGGGTPTLVDPVDIARLLDAIRSEWDLTPDCEITIEANPESTTADKLAQYRAAGVNRVSFGVQQLQPDTLQWLGRLHTAERALEAIAEASAIFERVSADLIFGVPGETDDSWQRTVEAVVDTGVGHVSAYALTYEPGTPLHEWKRLGRVRPVDEDSVADRYGIVHSVLTSAGLSRYEISNWSRPGHESAHNRNYWRFGEYLGLGAGAHSHLATPDASLRSWTVKNPSKFIDGVNGSTVASTETIDARLRAAEVMMLGLRTVEGVTFERFKALTGTDMRELFGDDLRWGLDTGLLESTTAGVVLSESGHLLANEIVSRFLP